MNILAILALIVAVAFVSGYSVFVLRKAMLLIAAEVDAHDLRIERLEKLVDRDSEIAAIHETAKRADESVED